jgi:uncharacterized protein (TIGR03084 family)
MTNVTVTNSGRDLVDSLVDDLSSESAVLRAVLVDLEPEQWSQPTPADGWTVTDQMTHLAYFDDVTRLSLQDPEQFRDLADRLVAGGDDFPDRMATRFRDTPPTEVLAWFDRARTELIAAYRAVDPTSRLPWFGPAMSPASSVTARIMETWAHGQDIFDTAGIGRVPTLSMRHVADIGIRALRYTYTVNGLEVPSEPIRVELTGPTGDCWEWGPDDAADRVRGDALEFCLVVTQRRHLDDTALEVVGPTASQWMGIAQAFPGRAPIERPHPETED